MSYTSLKDGVEEEWSGGENGQMLLPFAAGHPSCRQSMLGFDACVELVAVRSVSLLTHRTRRSSRGKTPSFAFLLKKIQFPKDVRKNNVRLDFVGRSLFQSPQQLTTFQI